MTPIEIKKARNRLSAQRSRDRKKQEMCDLRIITKKLLEENENLRKEIINQDNKINHLLDLLCERCRDKLSENITKKENHIKNLTEREFKEPLTSSNILINKRKMALLMTGLLAVFCVFGVFTSKSIDIKNNTRLLKEKNEIHQINNDEKRVNVPFIIEKDYTMRHQKELENKHNNSDNNVVNKNKEKNNLMVPVSLFQNNSKFLGDFNKKNSEENASTTSDRKNSTKNDKNYDENSNLGILINDKDYLGDRNHKKNKENKKNSKNY